MKYFRQITENANGKAWPIPTLCYLSDQTICHRNYDAIWSETPNCSLMRGGGDVFKNLIHGIMDMDTCQ